MARLVFAAEFARFALKHARALRALTGAATLAATLSRYLETSEHCVTTGANFCVNLCTSSHKCLFQVEHTHTNHEQNSGHEAGRAATEVRTGNPSHSQDAEDAQDSEDRWFCGQETLDEEDPETQREPLADADPIFEQVQQQSGRRATRELEEALWRRPDRLFSQEAPTPIGALFNITVKVQLSGVGPSLFAPDAVERAESLDGALDHCHCLATAIKRKSCHRWSISGLVGLELFNPVSMTITYTHLI